MSIAPPAVVRPPTRADEPAQGLDYMALRGSSGVVPDLVVAPEQRGRGIVTRQALFSTAGFSTRHGAYDVLPGGDGFLMLVRRDDMAGRQVVFVDRWQALLASLGARR